MNIKVDKEKLMKALELVSRVSTKHQTLPVLQCVLCAASKEDKKLVLKATNLEIGVEVSLDAEVDSTDMFAVPVAPLMQTMQLVSEKIVVLHLSGDVLNVETSRAHTEIKTLSHEEFPNISQIEGPSQEIQNSLFVSGVKSTAFATSQSSIKPELGSVLIHQQKEHTLTFVATDAFRLVEKTVSQKSVTLNSPLLVPCKNILEIARIAELVEDNPQIIISENQMAFRFPSGVYVTTRLTEASFPDYQQIIPKEFTSSVTVLRGDLMHALKKTNIFANAYLQVKVGIDPKENIITFSSEIGDFGNTKEPITASVDGEELSLSFNQRYLTDPLMFFTDDSVVLRFAGVGRPMVVEGVSDKTLRYLIMPMNR